MATNAPDKRRISDGFHNVATFGKQAVMSRAYLYPFKGIHFLLVHKTFSAPLIRHVLPTLALSAAVTSTMFAVTYVPQAAIMALSNGPFALLSAALLVLNESATIVLAISRIWWINRACTDSFDGVLIEKERTELVKHGREIKSTEISVNADAMARLGPVLKVPYDADGVLRSVLQYAVMLPINLIPVVGTPLFLILQARRLGIWNHARYYQLKGFSRKERKAFVWEHQVAYVSYGLSCVALNLIPMGNLIFAITNCIGAALWAAKIEQAEVEHKQVNTDRAQEGKTLFQGNI